MRNKNIIISPCGNKSSLFRTHWLSHKDDKQFDLCLLFYHTEIHNPELYKDAEYCYHLKDFKFTMIYDLFVNHAPELMEKYEYFYFIDDDVAIDTESINKMFAFSRGFDTWISQAALSHNSHGSWPILKSQPDCVLRYMGQIEVMAPLFNRHALKICLSSFTANKSSWGLDSVWSKMLDYPHNKIAVFDCITMRHTAAVGGGELYEKLQIDPYVEWKQVTEKYDAIANNFTELGRVQIIERKRDNFLFKTLHWRIKTKKVINHISKGDLFSSILSHFKEKRKDQTKSKNA